MTQPTAVLADTDFLPVLVHAGSSAFEIKLHIHTPVVALLPQLREQFLNDNPPAPTRKYLQERGVEWALEKGAMRERIEPEATLATAKVKPGADLYLTHRRRTEEYPTLRDDTAEGAAEVGRDNFAKVEEADSRKLAVWALPLGVVALGLIGVGEILAGNTQMRWPFLGLLSAITVLCIAVAAVLAKNYTEYRDVGVSMSVGAYAAVSAAALIAVPRELGVWHLTTIGAAAATVALVLWYVTDNTPASLHIGVGSAALILVVVGVLHLLLPVSPQATAAQIAFLSMSMIVRATKRSRNLNKVRVNYIAGEGEPVDNRTEISVKQASRRTTSHVAIESMLNQEGRVIATIHTLIGVTIASSITLVVAALAGGYFTRQYEWHMFGLIASASIVALAMGRGFVPRALAIPLLIAGPVTWAAYLVGRAISPTGADTVVLAAGTVPLVLGVLVSSLWGIRNQPMHSPLAKFRLELLALLAAVSAFPLTLVIMEVWPMVRNR
ncbi:type VII secretion integral membrane protein EccD (plasmid) [Tsukamurella tyrosinosolvens]|uniref:Type VII secretion integral membrane protein EccD n=1 Tax=Tsukamurella tyrosinosolvens TaxID=57704 RepID=A0A1H4VJ53_TSUTY|nr:type VII secretion integral membrane protein EccD [Tsukamurella tyrosinosolvens]KXO90961.1 type VII secretion integral membrane protein EccD [Tsukamurella tyrosinosolvens]SEC81016.1 type VII secretion integral membrane protein EccD [Tsukamurella tyrosinosolvens]VEH90483.1 type VII secretion integral membrane protein EccD [Tsukamurella tyrosinosolvens]